MKTAAVMLVAGLLAGTLAAPASAASETITGEVISLSCYFQNKANVGAAGAICAQATVKWEGNPAGLLTAAGKVYQLAGALVANNNAKVVPLLGHTVTVTGEVSENDGMTMITADQATQVQ